MPVPLSSRPQTFTDPDRNPHGGEADEDARAQNALRVLNELK